MATAIRFYAGDRLYQLGTPFVLTAVGDPDRFGGFSVNVYIVLFRPPKANARCLRRLLTYPSLNPVAASLGIQQDAGTVACRAVESAEWWLRLEHERVLESEEGGRSWLQNVTLKEVAGDWREQLIGLRLQGLGKRVFDFMAEGASDGELQQFLHMLGLISPMKVADVEETEG